MSLLAASCMNVAIGMFQSGAILESIPYFWTARVVGGSAAAESATQILLSQLAGLAVRALADGDHAAAQRLDSVGGIFDPESRAILTRDQAEDRSLARCNDAAAALSQDNLECAAAHVLAAAAYDPQNGLVQRYRASVIEGLLSRWRVKQAEGAHQDATLALALAVALGAQDQRFALMDMLEPLGDEQTVQWLCEQMAEDRAVRFADRFTAFLRGRRAAHRARRLESGGVEQESVEVLAAEETREWLAAQGPANEVETEVLSHRATYSFGYRGYRQTIEDLREYRRRKPEDPWIAHNLCSVIHNILDADVAAAAEIAMTAVTDDVDDLEQSYGFMWSMGAMPQALALADKLARQRPEYAAIAALYEMANDLDARPALVMGRERSGLPLLYANLVCWGDRYIDLMEQAAVASLLAPGNFPALAKKADVVLELFTMSADVPRLADSHLLRRLSAHCEIRVFPFPESVAKHANHLGYAPLGYANHATILRAERDGAGLTFLSPDVLYADGCYAAIARRLTDEPYAAFSDGLNAYRAPVLEALSPYRENGVLTVPPLILSDVGARFPTKRTLHSLYRPGNREVCANVTRVIFPTAEGLRVHGFVMLPAYVSHAGFSPMKLKSYATMDGVFSEHVLNKVPDKGIEVISPPEFTFIEICDDDGAVFPLVEKTLEQGVLDYFVVGCFNRRRHRLFIQPMLFPTLAPPDGAELVSDREIHDRLNGVNEKFARDPALTDVHEVQERIREQHYRQDDLAS